MKKIIIIGDKTALSTRKWTVIAISTQILHTFQRRKSRNHCVDTIFESHLFCLHLTNFCGANFNTNAFPYNFVSVWCLRVAEHNAQSNSTFDFLSVNGDKSRTIVYTHKYTHLNYQFMLSHSIRSFLLSTKLSLAHWRCTGARRKASRQLNEMLHFNLKSQFKIPLIQTITYSIHSDVSASWLTNS